MSSRSQEGPKELTDTFYGCVKVEKTGGSGFVIYCLFKYSAFTAVKRDARF